MITGTGDPVGAGIVTHPDVAMVSLTGSVAKESGYGKDLSTYALDDYTRIKHAMINLE